MSSTTLTQAQVQQISAVYAAKRNNPAAVWAALAGMGDQYAQAALQGITNPQSFFGQTIVNSNTISGVSQSQFTRIESDVADGYVQLIQSSQSNPDGTV